MVVARLVLVVEGCIACMVEIEDTKAGRRMSSRIVIEHKIRQKRVGRTLIVNAYIVKGISDLMFLY